jgi:hypothetical protein
MPEDLRKGAVEIEWIACSVQRNQGGAQTRLAKPL